MPAPRLNVNGGHWAHRELLPIQFDITNAFQHKIDFRHLFVIVRAGILLNVYKMETRNISLESGERPPSPAAGTSRRGNFVKLGDLKVRHCKPAARKAALPVRLRI
jgi:hypothetical protein